MGLDVFNDPQFADSFAPSIGGRIVRLSAEATRAIVSNYRGAKSKAAAKMYIMITPEGDLDPNWPFEHSWEGAERRVKEALLYLYNTNSKKCIRPVWFQLAGARTEWNCAWEKVRLVPVSRELDGTGLPANARLFSN